MIPVPLGVRAGRKLLGSVLIVCCWGNEESASENPAFFAHEL